MDRQCHACGERYEASRANSRFCKVACRVAARRRRAAGLPESSAPVPLVAEPDAVMTRAVRAELERAKRAGTFLGASALVLARAVDSGTASAAGLSSLMVQLRATMEAALVGAPSAADVVDEVTARRLRRQRGA